MPKVAFIQFIFQPMLGSMYLSSVLKKTGHQCVVIMGNKKRMLKKVDAEKPNMVAFSAMIGYRRWVIDMAKEIKEAFGTRTSIIVGGPLATFSPEIIENQFIDIICRGEGEFAVLELLNAIEKKADITKIKNLWVRKERKIFKNELRPLISNLDDIEFPDREFYKGYKFIQNDPTGRIIAGRGCSYDCAYCCEPSYRRLYHGKGRYIRKRTINNIIEELAILKERYGKKRIWFIDDLFPLTDKEWLIALLSRYRKEVALPFICNTRIDLLDERAISILKDSNYCTGISFAIETGKEKYRINVLKKNIKNIQIEEGVAILKKHKIKFHTTNMMGLPGETVEDALSTIKLNSEIKPDFSVCTIYQPLPQTQLAEFALKNKYINEECFSFIPFFSHGKSVLRQEDIQKIVNLHKFFYIALYLPYLVPLIKFLIKSPYNIIYPLLYNITYLMIYQRNVYARRCCKLFQEAIIAFKYYRHKW